MKKKILAALLAAVLLLGVLAGCAAKTDTAASSQQTPAASASAAQSAAASASASASASAAASASASAAQTEAGGSCAPGKSCDQNQPITKPVINLAGLKGPTSIGMVSGSSPLRSILWKGSLRRSSQPASASWRSSAASSTRMPMAAKGAQDFG